MDKKRISLLIGTLVICFLFTGCGNAIPEMTEEQTVLVTNYAASLLIKYDVNNHSLYLDQESLEKEEEMQQKIKEEAERLAKIEAEKEAKKAEKEKEDKDSGDENGSKGSRDEVVENINPADFLKLDGFNVEYKGVEYTDQYPESGDDLFFAISATPGCKLAVVHLAINNMTDAAKTVDIFSANAKYKVAFNDGSYKSIMSTLLTNDFSVFMGEIEPNASVDTVMLLELKEEECVDVNSVNLYIKYQDQAVKTKLY